MLNGTGDEERSSRQQDKHSSGNEQEIQEVKQEFEEHKTTSFYLGAGARIELAATENESVMLPLHHPAGSEEIFYRLKEEATKGIGEASNDTVFEFVKEIKRHGRTLFESVDSRGLFDLTALLWGGRLNQRETVVIMSFVPAHGRLGLPSHAGGYRREHRRNRLCIRILYIHGRYGFCGKRLPVFHGRCSYTDLRGECW